MRDRLTEEVAALMMISIDGEAGRRYTWPSVEVVGGFGCSLKTWGRSSTRGGSPSKNHAMAVSASLRSARKRGEVSGNGRIG